MSLKVKKCKNCRNEFIQFNSLQNVCSFECKKKLKGSKGEKIVKIKNEPDWGVRAWVLKAQIVFNLYIRKRDRGKECISCGKKWNSSFQAGHLFSGGGHSSVRFNELNVNGQCVQCNSGSNFDQGAYITELIKRTSEEEFEVLRSEAYEVKRWTVEELKKIHNEYKKRVEAFPEQCH